MPKAKTTNLQENVIFEDSLLKQFLLQKLGKGSEEEITIGELATVDIIEISETELSSLVGLEHATGLKKLTIRKTKVTDLEPLRNLTNLNVLLASGCQITDINVLENKNMESVWIDSTPITSLEPLRNSTNLININIQNTEVTDISPLANCTKLDNISMDNTKVTDISIVSGLPKLANLTMGYIPCRDLSPVYGKDTIENLNISGWGLGNSVIEEVIKFRKLKNLWLTRNNITDLTGLEKLPETLKSVLASYNSITNITPLTRFIGKEGVNTISVKNQEIILKETKEVIAGEVTLENIIVGKDGLKMTPDSYSNNGSYENDIIKWNGVNPSVSEVSFTFSDDNFTGTVKMPVTWKNVELVLDGCLSDGVVFTNNNFQTFINFKLTEQIDHLGLGDIIEINWMDVTGKTLKKITSTWSKFLTPINPNDFEGNIGNNPGNGPKVGFGDVIPVGHYAVSYINEKIAKVVVKAFNKPSTEIEGDKNNDGVVTEGEVVKTVIQSEVSGNTTMNITENGNVYACGDNLYGQLGLGRRMTNDVKQLERVSLGGVQKVVTSGKHTFFITKDGIYACGRNYEGQLGLGHFNDVFEPIKLSIEGVKEIVCSEINTFFIMEDGTVKCCGSNAKGELGVGHLNKVNTITDIVGLREVERISTNINNTLFYIKNKNVFGCGDNRYGQLGLETGKETYQTTPIKVRISMK